MGAVTSEAQSIRESIALHREALLDVLARYGASEPRLFGSVARGDAGRDSDVDVLVELEAGAGNELMRLAGIGEEFSRLLGIRVDVVASSLLRAPVSATALRDAVEM